VEYGTSGIPKYDEEGNITNAVIYCPTLMGGTSILAQHHKIIYDFNKDEYFFIKITSLGTPDSCSPSSTGLKYNFPEYTISDRVNFKRQFLAEKFKINKLLGIIGEGTGGFETYDWASEYPDEMEFIIILNSTYKTWGYRYVMTKTAEAIIESCDDFYSDGYSVSLSKVIVALTRLMFTGYFSKNVYEGLSNDEIDVLMEDYVDEGLFMDIYDFKSRNDCLLEYDVYDKLSNIKANSLIMGTDGYLYFNAEKDILPLKDVIEDSKVVSFSDKQDIYGDEDYSDIGFEVASFLKPFK
jgi:homoserine O-acetyltransferase